MKKIILILTLIICTINCTYSQKEISFETIDMINNDRSFPMPKGTKLYQNDNGSTKVVLQNGYKYIVKNTRTNNLSQEGGGSVSCLCNKESGGCSPAQASGKFACVMVRCSDCTKSEAFIGNSGDIEVVILGIIQNDKNPLKFLSSKKIDKETLFDLFNSDEIPYFNNLNFSIFEFDDAKTIIDAYLNSAFSKNDVSKIKSGANPSVDFGYILVDFYGNTMALMMPKEVIEKNQNLIQINGGSGTSSWSCTCNGSGSCKSIWIPYPGVDACNSSS